MNYKIHKIMVDAILSPIKSPTEIQVFAACEAARLVLKDFESRGLHITKKEDN